MLFLGNQMLYFTCVLTQKNYSLFLSSLFDYTYTYMLWCTDTIYLFLTCFSQGEPGYKGPDGDPVCTYPSNDAFLILEFSSVSGRWCKFPFRKRSLPFLTLSLPGCLMEFCKVTQTFESVDEILRCDHSKKALCLHFHIVLFVFQNFTKWNLQTCSKFAFGFI